MGLHTPYQNQIEPLYQLGALYSIYALLVDLNLPLLILTTIILIQVVIR